MGAVNSAIIEVVEAVLDHLNRPNDDILFNKLMDELLSDTTEFWLAYRKVIPVKHRALFKCNVPHRALFKCNVPHREGK